MVRATRAAIASSRYQRKQSFRRKLDKLAGPGFRLRVSGIVRASIEVACEAITLSLYLGVLALILASPALRLTREQDRLRQTELADSSSHRIAAIAGGCEAATLEEYPDFLIKAVLATEDRRFYQHFGIDIEGVLRALFVDAKSPKVVQGGSTITQQLAKNLFFNNERTIARKIHEAFVAVWLEHRLTKGEILELYLDCAYLGEGVYGMRAAAAHYFGKAIENVTMAEAALLAGLLQAPNKYAPDAHPLAARFRARSVLHNLVAAHFVDRKEILPALRDLATMPLAQAQRHQRFPYAHEHDYVQPLGQ
jgi:penicillin-binding protein 1A